MTNDSQASLAVIEASISTAAGRRSKIGTDLVADMARACGMIDGGARTRLLIAHLQEGEEASSSIALCTDAIEKRTTLGFFSHALLNHAPPSARTLWTFIGVVKAAMPAHSAARIKRKQPITVCPLYDAMWSGRDLVARAPLAEGFSETFEGVLVHALQPLLHHTTFVVSRREGDQVYLALGERENFVTDDFWVAPPCILIAGTLGSPKGYVVILLAKLRRGFRRLRMRLGR